jgi:hypothetical protein
MICADLVQAKRDLDPMFVYYSAFSMAEHLGSPRLVMWSKTQLESVLFIYTPSPSSPIPSTHIDSPQHLVRTEAIAARNDPIDRVPLQRLVGEACVIDIPAHGRANPDYLITVDDVLAWEAVWSCGCP